MGVGPQSTLPSYTQPGAMTSAGRYASLLDPLPRARPLLPRRRRARSPGVGRHPFRLRHLYEHDARLRVSATVRNAILDREAPLL